ncbi:hypothetical protein GFM02_31065 [Rhizobium leguminosarum bv. viciae]|nr:hypothetical protein [Rhizobium leguminosarum bv. viciae]NKM65978.1 hypothetical protein [Rhizobium leguminosarum bv. viciae]
MDRRAGFPKQSSSQPAKRMMGRKVVPLADLPPCGGDARQGRGGCPTVRPLYFVSVLAAKKQNERPEDRPPKYHRN